MPFLFILVFFFNPVPSFRFAYIAVAKLSAAIFSFIEKLEDLKSRIAWFLRSCAYASKERKPKLTNPSPVLQFKAILYTPNIVFQKLMTLARAMPNPYIFSFSFLQLFKLFYYPLVNACSVLITFITLLVQEFPQKVLREFQVLLLLFYNHLMNCIFASIACYFWKTWTFRVLRYCYYCFWIWLVKFSSTSVVCILGADFCQILILSQKTSLFIKKLSAFPVPFPFNSIILFPAFLLFGYGFCLMLILFLFELLKCFDSFLLLFQLFHRLSSSSYFLKI